jgi:hypothetical protein
LCGGTIEDKTVSPGRASKTMQRKLDQRNQIQNLGISPTKLQAAGAANTSTMKKDEGVNTRSITLSKGTCHWTFYYYNVLFAP